MSYYILKTINTSLLITYHLQSQVRRGSFPCRILKPPLHVSMSFLVRLKTSLFLHSTYGGLIFHCLFNNLSSPLLLNFYTILIIIFNFTLDIVHFKSSYNFHVPYFIRLCLRWRIKTHNLQSKINIVHYYFKYFCFCHCAFFIEACGISSFTHFACIIDIVICLSVKYRFFIQNVNTLCNSFHGVFYSYSLFQLLQLLVVTSVFLT